VADRLSYFAYGLHICADFALWPWGGSASPPSAECDVRVELVGEGAAFDPRGFAFAPGRADAVLDWPGVGSFRITHGERILIRPARDASTDEVALIAAGPAFALLLEQRGCAVLHGSSVARDGEGIALLGASGAGKSTTAATLGEHGYALLSDGMTALDLSGSVPQVLPGPPHFKLWPDAVRALAATAVASHPIARQEEKRWYDARGSAAREPVPLRRVYLLATGVGVQCLPTNAASGLMGLVQNYFLADFADAAGREFILHRCARVASAVTIWTLRRGDTLGDLAAVVEALSSARQR